MDEVAGRLMERQRENRDGTRAGGVGESKRRAVEKRAARVHIRMSAAQNTKIEDSAHPFAATIFMPRLIHAPFDARAVCATLPCAFRRICQRARPVSSVMWSAAQQQRSVV